MSTLLSTAWRALPFTLWSFMFAEQFYVCRQRLDRRLCSVEKIAIEPTR